MSINEINEKLDKCKGWSIDDMGRSIRKDFQFQNFKEVLDFVNKIAEISDGEDHHPDLRIWGGKNLEVKLTTHLVNRLTDKDFNVAERIDVL